MEGRLDLGLGRSSLDLEIQPPRSRGVLGMGPFLLRGRPHPPGALVMVGPVTQQSSEKGDRNGGLFEHIRKMMLTYGQARMGDSQKRPQARLAVDRKDPVLT